MQKLQWFSLGCAAILLVGVAAVQTSGATSQDAPSSPQMQQSNPSQAAPSNTPSPQAQASQGQERSIDDELGLTPDQKQKIAAVVDDENKQISTVRDDKTMTLDQKKAKVIEIRQAGAPRIKAILTPEQLQKLAALQEKNRQEQNTQQAAPPQKP